MTPPPVLRWWKYVPMGGVVHICVFPDESEPSTYKTKCGLPLCDAELQMSSNIALHPTKVEGLCEHCAEIEALNQLSNI